jgi:hypothetical protein
MVAVVSAAVVSVSAAFSEHAVNIGRTISRAMRSVRALFFMGYSFEIYGIWFIRSVGMLKRS